MATMIIVEDESFEREALLECMDWNMINVKITGVARNGKEGLELIINSKPDIILTDVKMHIMDGIEMIRNVRKFNDDVQIIFLSSYDNFEYAQEAVALNAFAYLTKPINELGLLETVKMAANKAMETKLKKQLDNRIQQSLKEREDLARQAILIKILNGICSINESEIYSLAMGWLVLMKQYGIFLCILEEIQEERLIRLDKKMKSRGENCASVVIDQNRVVSVVEEKKDGCSFKNYMELFEECFPGQNEMYHIKCRSEGEAVASVYNNYISLLCECDIKKKGLKNAEHTSSGSKKDRNVYNLKIQKKAKTKVQIVEEVVAIIREHYGEAITIEGIAKSLHYTPNYLGSVFRSECKESFNHYLTRYRLEKCCEKLAGSNKSIQDIALECGYENVTYFHVIFKKEIGVTPAKYRENPHVELKTVKTDENNV